MTSNSVLFSFVIQVDETIGLLFEGDRPGKPSVRANFIVVGPFTDSAKIATGTYLCFMGDI